MKFKCLECGRDFGQITGKHLKLHGFNTVTEYKEKYPDAQTVRARTDSLETIEKKRQARLGYKHSEETKAKIGSGNLGKKMSEEAIDKWRASYKKYLDEHGSPMLGIDRGDAFRKKMSEIAKNRPNELVQQKVKMMNDARRGNRLTDEQKQRYSEARLKYIAENPDCLPNTLFNTKPERDFAAELDRRNINYNKGFPLGGRLFDFKIGNDILVEIDGPYHWNIDMYGNKSTPIEEKQEKFNVTIKIDSLKNQIAKDNGFKLFRIKTGSNLWNDWYDQLKNQGWNLF